MIPHHDIEAADIGLAVGGGQHGVGADEGAATEWSAPPGADQSNLTFTSRVIYTLSERGEA